MSGKYVFGPIGSRRLGVSLGVDLAPRKTCTQDCPYCEAGWTTNLTLERREYVKAKAVISELKEVLGGSPKLDYVTFSGAGEPTLNSKLGEVVDFIKRAFPRYRLCLLTNGTLLGDAEVQAEVAPIDLVIPNLDASNEAEFQAINRPAAGLNFARHLKGLQSFCAIFPNRVWLELFIAPGINDSAASIARFAELIATLKVEKVQLNSLDRPGCDPTLLPAQPSTVQKFIRAIEPTVPVEAVGAFCYKSPELRGTMPPDELAAQVLATVKRRQATLEDLEMATDCEPEMLKRVLADLLARGLIEREKGERGEFYGFFS